MFFKAVFLNSILSFVNIFIMTLNLYYPTKVLPHHNSLLSKVCFILVTPNYIISFNHSFNQFVLDK